MCHGSRQGAALFCIACMREDERAFHRGFHTHAASIGFD
jgi:hypothetical protein